MLENGASTPAPDAEGQSGAPTATGDSNTSTPRRELSDADKVRKTMGREIKTLRGELEALKAELAKANPAGETEPDEKTAKIRDAVKADFEKAYQPEIAKRDAKIATYEKKVIDSALTAALGDAHYPDLVARDLRNNVRINDEGDLVVVDSDGDETGETVADLVAKHKEAFPALFKGTLREGADFRGSKPAKPQTLAEKIKTETNPQKRALLEALALVKGAE